MDVLDLQAEIAGAAHDVYEVTLRGPDGAQSSTRTRLPLSLDDLRALVARIPDSLIASSAAVRRSVPPEEQPVQLLGRHLFETLTAGGGGALLAAAQHTAALDERQLRLVLRVRPPELAHLPWEFLFDAGQNGYVCPTTPLIRHPQVAAPERPLPVPPPLRILCMIARPGDQETLAVETERQQLGSALEELRHDGLIELGWVGGESRRELRAALRRERGPWHIFHFIGHGGFDPVAREGTLALSDGAGGTYHLGAENFAMVLRNHQSLRLVVLNACETGRADATDPFSSVAGALMQAGLPAALAMQYPISDPAAIEFSQTFYEGLAGRLTVDAAVTEARQSIRLALPGTLEWGTPVLYMRSLDGRLFDIGRERPTRAQATQADELYARGLAALHTERWDDAVAAFRMVTALDRTNPNGAAKLEEALRGRRLDHLHTAAVGAADAGRWDDAVEHLTAILAVDPAYRDARARLDLARTRQTVAALRAEARTLHAAGQFDAVLAIGVRLARLAPEDPDPDGVVTSARLASARQRRAGPPPRERPRAVAAVPVARAESGRPDRPAPVGGPARRQKAAVAAPGRVVELVTPKPAWSVAFGPGGDRIAVGCDRRSAVLLDLEGGRLGRTHRLWGGSAPAFADGRVRCLAFTPDGQRIALSGDCQVRVCDAGTGGLVAEVTAGRHDVSAVAFCGNSRLVAASDHGVGIWTVERPTRSVGIDHEDSVYALAVSPDGTRLASAGRSYLHVWDARMGERLLRIEYGAMVFAVDFSPDGTRLATAGLDRTARVWDAATGECLIRLELPDRVRGVAFGPDGTRLAFASGSAVAVRELSTGRTVLERDGDFGDVTMLQVAYSPDGRHLATVGGGKAWLIPLQEVHRD